jgi:hypothetical protein
MRETCSSCKRERKIWSEARGEGGPRKNSVFRMCYGCWIDAAVESKMPQIHAHHRARSQKRVVVFNEHDRYLA